MRDPDFFLYQYAPVSTGFSMIDIGYDDVVQHWVEWSRSLEQLDGWDVPVMKLDCGLDKKLELLLPLDGQKRLLTETSNGQVAIFSNMQYGDGSSDAAYLAYKFRRAQIDIHMVKDGKTGSLTRIGSTQFNWADYGHETGHWVGHKFRSIAAHKESRWEWHESGDPFSWEEFETYKQKRVKDRFTPEMVERYCGHFGVVLFDPDFYRGRATLMSLRPPSMLNNFDPNIVYPQSYPNCPISVTTPITAPNPVR